MATVGQLQGIADYLEKKGMDGSAFRDVKADNTPWWKRAAGGAAGALIGGAAMGPVGYLAGAAIGGSGPGRFKNWNNPSEWRGGEVGDAANLISGRTAAQEQEDAAKEASAKAQGVLGGAQDFTTEQLGVGRSDIQGGTGQATGALTEGQQGGLAALMAGQDKAAQALSGAPNRLSALLSDPNSFQQDPGYQFRLKQGEDAIMRNFAARGGRGGGDAMKAILEHGQNFATNEYGNAINRASTADQADINRASSLANLYSGTGSQAAGINTGTGAQLAQLLYGSGNNLAGLGMQAAGINSALAGNIAQAQMAPVQYAGGANQATANFANSLLSAGGQIGGAALGSYMGRPAAAVPPPTTVRA